MIRLARVTDWEAIASWRNEHFRRIRNGSVKPRPVTKQHTLDDAAWLVLAAADDTPLAALSYTEDVVAKIRFGQDMYAAPGHSVAGLLLGETFERMCDQQGYEIRASTDPENVGYIRLMLRRGYEVVSVELKRAPRLASEGTPAGI